MYPFYFNNQYMQNNPYCPNYSSALPYLNSHYFFPFQKQNYGQYCQVMQNILPNLEKVQEPSFTSQVIERKDEEKLMKIRKSHKSQRMNSNLMKIRRIKKKERVCEREQKQNRNTYSNILRNFFKRINDWICVKDLVSNIIKNKNLSLTVMEFYQHSIENKVDHSRYVCLKNITYLFDDEEYPMESTIYRVLFAIYLSKNAITQILTSKKIGRVSLRTHIDGIRELKERIFNHV